MFINIMQFPPIQSGKETEFLEWFTWSNEQYAQHEGFIRRRLLKSRKGDQYVALVEHESFETFMAMHTSPTQAEAMERVKPLFAGNPIPQFYEMVLE